MAINDVSLTTGMRSNLLSLQGTVDLLNRTQNRLSTGKKVNTAMDNPVSFFASQALTSRASVIDSLKDAMGQAVQTITAADKGITAISSMIEQAKGIAQSALSAEASSGFGTEAVEINGLANTDSITVGGITLTAGPTAIVTSVNTAFVDFGANTAAAGNTVKIGGVTFTASAGSNTVTYDSFDLNMSANTLEGGDTLTVGGLTYTATAGSQSAVLDNLKISTAIAVGNKITVAGQEYTAVAGDPANALEFKAGVSLAADATAFATAVNAHQAGVLTIVDDTAGGLTFTSGSATIAADSVTSGAVTVTPTTHNVDNPLGVGQFLITGDANADATNLRAAINARQGTGNGDVYVVGGVTSTVTITHGTAALAAGTVALGTASSTDIAITTNVTTTANPLAAGQFSIAGATASAKALALRTAIQSMLGAGAYTINEDGAGKLSITAGTTALDANTAVEVSASIDVSTGTSTAYGALAADEFAVTGNDITDAQSMANAINSAAITGYSATASNGVLTIANSTATITADMVTVSSATKMDETLVAADSELGNLQAQYSAMLDQIDTLAADSGYKGKNLLGSSLLSVKFEGDHKLDVQGFDASSSGLSIGAATWTAGGSINDDITALDAAKVTLQSQSSKLSGNLSVITVRQSFSTNMINTLTAGSDLLVQADTNEEGANMLMLQTRQSLSTTALSLSAQAAQSVLKLFG